MPDFSKTSQIALVLSLPASAVIAYWLYLKWSSESDDCDHKKVATSHSTRIKVLVPRKAVGTVIGKMGATIKRVQAETGARLNFNDRSEENDGKPRVLLISGTPEAAQKAELIVYQIIAEMPEILTEQIEVPFDCVGRIIGKGGVVIRDIRRASGVKIDIDKDQGRNENGMRTVILSGSRTQIDLGIELIEDIVKKAEEEKQLDKDRGDYSNNIDISKDFKNARKDLSFKDALAPREKGSIKASAVPVEEGDLWDESMDEDVIGVGTVNNNNNSNERGGAPLSTDPFIQIMVSAVEHPGHFWVQHVGPQSLHLEQMQKDLTQLLAFEESRISLSVTDPQPGDLVAAHFDGEDPIFYRAKVLGVTKDGMVDLYFMDYGDNAFVPMDKIYKLRSEFQEFPHQAIQCQLAQVRPLSERTGWQEEAIALFEDLVYCAQWKPLCAKVVTHARIHSEDQGQGHGTELRPCLQIIDTSGEQDIDVAKELVRQGHARLTETDADSRDDNNRPTTDSPSSPLP